MYKYLFCLIGFFLLSRALVCAEKQFFLEDFNNGLEQWELINGNWSYWQINNQVLYGTLNQSHKLSTLVPKDEYWQNMMEYSVDFVFKVFDSSDKNFVLGMRDANNFYDFHFYDQQLIVEDIRNGLSVHFATVPCVLLKNQAYQIHLLYSKAKIELWINGQLIFGTDQSWPAPIYGGKFGVKIATGGMAYSRAAFSQIRVSEINSNNVLFKQTDPIWSDAIYDHAAQWSAQPTIARFGCALSAAAMLLRAYGFMRLENGEELNPLTLNQWLKTQNDGYLGDGLVNWLAISRLSYVLSEQAEALLPKLEFSYFAMANAHDDHATLQSLLTNSQGQIASDGQHFFVIEQYVSESDDFKIKDPFYDQEFLSQKEQAIHSLRLFTPSQTDLGYFLLVLPRELTYLLTDADAHVLETSRVLEEIAFEEERIGSAWQLIYYPKPASETFTLRLSSAQFTQDLLEKSRFYLYQSNGQVQTVNLIELLPVDLDYVNLASINLQIHYAKDETSAIEVTFANKTLDEQKMTKLAERTTWATAQFNQGKLSFYLFYQLNLLIDSLREHLDYFFLLEKFLEFHQL